MANKAPGEKHLQFGSFVVHATRGVIRQQTIRRKTMFALLALAMLLLFSGCTFLSSVLNPREHLFAALLFWSACVWLTLTALLLAMFDLVAVRRSGRREALNLKRQYSDDASESKAAPRQSHSSGSEHDA